MKGYGILYRDMDLGLYYIICFDDFEKANHYVNQLSHLQDYIDRRDEYFHRLERILSMMQEEMLKQYRAIDIRDIDDEEGYYVKDGSTYEIVNKKVIEIYFN